MIQTEIALLAPLAGIMELKPSALATTMSDRFPSSAVNASQEMKEGLCPPHSFPLKPVHKSAYPGSKCQNQISQYFLKYSLKVARVMMSDFDFLLYASGPMPSPNVVFISRIRIADPRPMCRRVSDVTCIP